MLRFAIGREVRHGEDHGRAEGCCEGVGDPRAEGVPQREEGSQVTHCGGLRFFTRKASLNTSGSELVGMVLNVNFIYATMG
jgi:hypothetical protein